MRSLRPGLRWSRKILVVSIASSVLLCAHIAFAGDDNQCTGALLRTSTPAEQPEDVDKTIRALSELRLRLDLAQVSGSRAIERTAVEAEFKRKEQELIAYLEAHQLMTHDELRRRMRREIAQLQNRQEDEQRDYERAQEEEKRQRTEQDEYINNYGTRAIFARIEPGTFLFGDEGAAKVSVTLENPFEMLTIPTTQVIWKTVAELANKRFGSKYQINVDPSKFKGDTRPVEQVTYDDVQTWLSALNDLSQAGEPLLVDVIPDHKRGDVYRFPTETEWEFVIRGRGKYNGAFHFGNRESQLGDYAWSKEDSGQQTHPVAQKKPLVIDGKEFYDMHGNVWEWVQGAVLRGGSWGNPARGLYSGFRYKESRGTSHSSIGFRFVREIKREKRKSRIRNIFSF